MQQNDVREQCLFCKIADGKIPATIVHTTADTVAFRDVNPQAPTHILVIPRVHVPNAAAAAGQGLWEPVMSAASAVALSENLGQRGYRLVVNSGPDAGQSVEHLHVHVLGGRHLAWPPG